MDRCLWLVIAPYVYIVCSRRSAEYLLYNTVDGSRIQGDDVRILDFLLSSPQYAACMDERQLEVYSPFITELKEKHMGDVIESSADGFFAGTYPIKNLQGDFKRYADKLDYLSGSHLVQYLHELTVYVNHSCTNSCACCSAYYKQHVHCLSNGFTGRLDVNVVLQRLHEASYPCLRQINILGGDIGMNADWKYLSDGLCDLGVVVNHIVHISQRRHLPDELFRDRRWTILIDMHGWDEENAAYDVNAENIHYDFWVHNEEDCRRADELANKFGLHSWSITPYYDSKNYDFFKNNVFIDENDVFLRTHTFRDLYRNATLNSHYFGKLTIMADGQIYADVTKPALGNISEHTLAEVIWKELESGHSWLRTRSRQKPCKDCVLHDFCPPTSGIESAMRKNDLCFRSKR